MSLQVPLNPQSASGSDGFAPIYDPDAVNFARKVNAVILVAVVIASLVAIAVIFSLIAVDESASVRRQLISGFAVPIFLVMLSYLAASELPHLIGFDLRKVYAHTQRDFSAWLPSEARFVELKMDGDFEANLAKGFAKSLSDDMLKRTIKGIARGVQSGTIRGNAGFFSVGRGEDGLYRLSPIG